jgi:hypothetical protein
MRYPKLIAWSVLSVFISFLSGCGGGGSGSTDSDNPSQGVSTNRSITIGGSVMDGPVAGASIVVKDANNKVVATTTSDAQARYRVQVPVDAAYPLTVMAAEGTDMVTGKSPAFSLVTTVIDPNETTAHINPFSTLIVKTAQFMPGGLTQSNVETANEDVLRVFNAGLDTDLVSNPIATPLDAANAATFVKASEVLAEIIRRNYSKTADVSPYDINLVVDSLAADLVDGTLDGLGGPGANKKLSQLITVGSAQVLIEAMSNNLQVDNRPVANELDSSIRAIAPNASSTTELAVTMNMLTNAKTALAAAILIAPGAALADVQSAMNAITPGMGPSDVGLVLPAEQASVLDDAIALASLTDSSSAGGSSGSAGATPITRSTAGIYFTGEGSGYQFSVPASTLTRTLRVYLGGWSSTAKLEAFLSDGSAAPVVMTLDNKSTYDRLVTLTYRASSNGQTLTVRHRLIGAYNTGGNIALQAATLQEGSSVAAPILTGTLSVAPQAIDVAAEGSADWAYWGLDAPSSVNRKANTRLISDISLFGEQPRRFLGASGWSQVAWSDGISAPTTTWNAAVVSGAGSAGGSTNPSTSPIPSSEIPSSDDQAEAPAASAMLTLSWSPNTDGVLGYKVYYGSTGSSAVTEVTDITVYSGGFDPSAPSVQYDAREDLGLSPGDDVCFRLRAYNNEGMSELSAPICDKIS